MSKITFAEDAWEEYLYWQMQDKKTLKKINKLLKDIQREPFTGEGKPEPLTGKKTNKILLPATMEISPDGRKGR